MSSSAIASVGARAHRGIHSLAAGDAGPLII
jgi:hypothetical protein